MEIKKTGIVEFDNRALNLCNTINSLPKEIDVSEYEQKLTEIVDSVIATYYADNNRGNKAYAEDMKTDYATNSVSKQIRDVEYLTKKINNDELLFSYILELNNKIEKKLEDFSLNNIDNIIEAAIKLLQIVSQIKLCDTEFKQNELNRAYYNIYQVLKIETLFDRKGLIKEIVKQEKSYPVECIHSYMNSDLNQVDFLDKVDDLLKGIELEGLDYDPVNQEMLLKIAVTEYPNVREFFLEDKDNNVRTINKIVDDYNLRANSAKEDYRKTQSIYRSEKRGDAFKRSVEASILAVPIGLTILGGFLGHNHTKTKYETITNEYDLSKQEIIEQDKEYSTEFWVDKTVTIKKYDPWEKAKDGYKRTVTSYKYDGELDLSNGKMPTLSELKKHMLRDDVKEETADTIDQEDNKSYFTIKYSTVNKDKQKEGHRTGAGIFIGILASIIYALLMVYIDVEYISDYNTAETRKELEQAKKRIEKMKKEQEEKLKQIEEIKKRYGIDASQIITSEVEDLSNIKTTKRK